jgi:hypothetical protein
LPAGQLPPLEEPYATALREALDYLLTRFDPAGIIASGTIVRGNPGPSSDLDLYVIVARPERQRLQRFFHGVPAEIFVNSLPWIERYFVQERAAGRPVTAHMLASGVVLHDRQGVASALRRRAAEDLAVPPQATPAQLVQWRYLVATLFEDACDLAQDEPEMARAFLFQVVAEALRYRFLEAGVWHPRAKALLHALDELDPLLTELARRFYRACTLDEQLGLAREIVTRTSGETGFFAWETEPESE